MEKAASTDSMTTVDVKDFQTSVDNYANSVQEAPPAYRSTKSNQQSTAVQVTKIIAVTIVAVTVILGSFIVLAAWVNARASCVTLEIDEPMDHQSYNSLPVPEKLQQSEYNNPRYQLDNKMDNIASSSSSEEDLSHIIRLPLQLTFDDVAGHSLERNARARMNCLVEKKKAEEIVDQQPKSVNLPLGLNLTTDPRYVHFTGEKMAIVCESGQEQRHAKPMMDQQHPMHPSMDHMLMDADSHPGAAQLIPIPHNFIHMFPPPPQAPLPQSLPFPFPMHRQQIAQGRSLPLHQHPDIIVVSENHPRNAPPQHTGRALPHPISLPLRDLHEEVHAHYIVPRSVDAVNKEHKREKRVKRCACDCSC